MIKSPLDEYKRLTISLHALGESGKTDSPEYAALCEEMSDLAWKLPISDVAEANQFSNDCYSVLTIARWFGGADNAKRSEYLIGLASKIAEVMRKQS